MTPSPSDQTPRTEAGREFAERLSMVKGAAWPQDVAAILAIEAEAAAQARAEGLDVEVLGDGWVFDGVRRLYDEGHVSNRWVARAVKPVPDDERPDDDNWTVPLRIGHGNTPSSALADLRAILAGETE